jgi:hypothetical protein
MENQHKKIKGYRDLSQSEIDLMNEIKAHAEKTRALLDKVKNERERDRGDCLPYLIPEQFNESMRCLALAKTNLQTGQMWFVRAVALPDSF